ncbi:MAG: NUDIX domain-containing protein [Caldimonas sp.]
MTDRGAASSWPAWLAELRAHADRPPLRPRDALCIGTARVGSIESELARRIVAGGLPLRLVAERWTLDQPVDDAMRQIAQWLRANGIGGAWRNELLAVDDAHGRRLGAIERSAVRPLGIATRAVHLVGRSPRGDYWVQQRAFDKAVDPGLWDTTMGGLVAAGESIAATLARETDEEAGLAIDALDRLRPAGRITIRRPIADGYMVEHIEIFEAVVPKALQPVNRDGEVERFECIATDALIERLRAGAFTLEAALILAAALQRDGLLSG